MKGIVYILKAEDSRFYVGSTTDLNRRLRQHASGHTPTTLRMADAQLVFQQEFSSLLVARKIEYRLKKFHRKDFIEKIIQDGKIKISGD